jgi:hypothetical protein
MTFPTAAAMITRRKSFGICGPAIVVPSDFLALFQSFIASRHAARMSHRDSSRADRTAVPSEYVKMNFFLASNPGVEVCVDVVTSVRRLK